MTTLKSNMLKKGKKGFTLTELAIVIAVIAILIAVLVPTFTSVINSARRTSAAETAKNALTEYTVETYSSVPDDSYVIYEGYCWKVENGSFEVSDDIDIDPDDTDYKEGTVQYTWGKDADAGITEVELYTPASEMTTSVAKVIAQNYANNYKSGDREVTYVGVAYSTASSSLTNGISTAAVKLTASAISGYYYYAFEDGAIKGSVTTTAPTDDFTDEKTYTGIIIGYSSASESAAAAAKAAMPTESLSDGDVYYAAVTVGSEGSASYWFKLTYNKADDSDGTWSVETSTSDAYTNTAKGQESSANTSTSGYSVIYKAANVADSTDS